MLKISDCSKFATDPEYSEVRGTCWGVAIFIATILALGTIAMLTAGASLHTLFTLDQAPAYAQMNI